MKNLKLLQLLESVLGKGKQTSGDNIAFFSPFTSHYKPKLEIDIIQIRKAKIHGIVGYLIKKDVLYIHYLNN